MFEHLPDIDIDNSKHELVPYVDLSNINATIIKEESIEDK